MPALCKRDRCSNPFPDTANGLGWSVYIPEMGTCMEDRPTGAPVYPSGGVAREQVEVWEGVVAVAGRMTRGSVLDFGFAEDDVRVRRGALVHIGL